MGKYIARLPWKGGFRYFYSKAELQAFKEGAKKTAKNAATKVGEALDPITGMKSKREYKDAKRRYIRDERNRKLAMTHFGKSQERIIDSSKNNDLKGKQRASEEFDKAADNYWKQSDKSDRSYYKMLSKAKKYVNTFAGSIQSSKGAKKRKKK